MILSENLTFGLVRVIAGSAKGRRLIGPDTRETRPLTDRAREAVFSALAGLVGDAEVLDLYAGSGSIGIEALSRGAGRVVFVEKGREALSALRQNLTNLGFANVTVVGQDVEEFLRTATGQFDLIFFDPPWAMETQTLTEQMQTADRLAVDEAEIVIHRRRSDPTPAPPYGWRLLTTRRYGDGVIHRYEKSSADPLDEEQDPKDDE
ncbi:MAG: 16S rRNA (guanine(966)-N(2))-methyltransferase RsmD [Acidimicrobiia bacterium]